MATDTVERQYVSRYSIPGFGLKVYKAGVLSDADASPTLRLIPEGAVDPSWTGVSSHDGVGTYSATLSSVQTSTPMLATLMWDYSLDGVAQVYGLDIEVGPSMPTYDALPQPWKDVIEQAWYKFADAFDSPYGGPNLQVYAQTHFNRNRFAQLLADALQNMNAAASPYMTYPLGGDNFPLDEWGNLLSDLLYVEVLKHLVRSYVEQPEVILGTAISRVDRRDYMQRWQEILTIEDRDNQRDLSRWRQAHMGLGNVSVLVSGGAYGNWGPTEPPGGLGAAAARGYFWLSRWH